MTIDPIIEQASESGNITFDDVKNAVGDTDPNATNVNRIRAILGRGSNQTIQRHLNTMRAALKPEPLMQALEAPPAPKDLIQSIWSQAWQTAQAQTSGALAMAIERREQSERELGIAEADRDACQYGQDTAAEMLEKERIAAAEAMQVIKNEVNALMTERDTLKNELNNIMDAAAASAVKAESELDAVKKDAALAAERASAAAALSEAKHQAVIESMRSEIDRLVNQLADLRSAFKGVQVTPKEIKEGSEKGEE